MATKRGRRDSDDDDVLEEVTAKLKELKALEVETNSHQKLLTDSLARGNDVTVRAYSLLLEASLAKVATLQEELRELKKDLVPPKVSGAKVPSASNVPNLGGLVTPGPSTSSRKIVSSAFSSGGRRFTCGSLVHTCNTSLYGFNTGMTMKDFSAANSKLAEDLWSDEMSAKGLSWNEVFDTVPKEQHSEGRTPLGQYNKSKRKAIKYAMGVVFGRKVSGGESLAEIVADSDEDDDRVASSAAEEGT